MNDRAAEASASLTLARQSTETTNKQCGQEDAATYGPLGPPREKHLAASDYNKLSSVGSLSQHCNGLRATYMHDRQQLM